MRAPSAVTKGRWILRWFVMIAGLGGGLFHACAQDNVILPNTTIANGQVVSVHADQTITAPNGYVILSGGNATLTAGTRISLEPGVDAHGGSAFRAVIDRNQNGIADWREESMAVELPYFTSFESSDSFHAGSVDQQNNWFAGPGTVSIGSAGAVDGAWAVTIPPSTPTKSLEKHFLPYAGASVIYVDFFIRPVFTASTNSSSLVDLGNAQIAFVQNGGVGKVEALDNGQWQADSHTININTQGQAVNWLGVTVRLDYSAKTWELFVNGAPSGVNFDFVNPTANLSPYVKVYGSTAADTLFDEFYIGLVSPLAISNDVNQNGIDDNWEMLYFGNLTTCTATSKNNLDGLLDRDEAALGLNPTTNNLTASANNTVYHYNLRDQLTAVSPVAGGMLSFSPDAEGNLQ